MITASAATLSDYYLVRVNAPARVFGPFHAACQAARSRALAKLAVLSFLIVGISVASGATVAKDQNVVARVTVYWRGEASARGSWKGTRLCNGNCAVDPHKIPYGSKVIVGGDELVAVDTGPAVVSRRAARSCARNSAQRSAVVIDRYFETKREAKAWEKGHPQYMMVKVVPPADRTAKNSTRASKNENSVAAKYFPLVALAANPLAGPTPLLADGRE